MYGNRVNQDLARQIGRVSLFHFMPTSDEVANCLMVLDENREDISWLNEGQPGCFRVVYFQWVKTSVDG
jgi:hypothetical protein